MGRFGLFWVSILWGFHAFAAQVTVDVENFALQSGATGSISYQDIGGSGVCSAMHPDTCTLTYNDTDTVSLTAIADSGSVFSDWYTTGGAEQSGTGGAEQSGPCSGNSGPTCTFPASELVTTSWLISADFTLQDSSAPQSSDLTLFMAQGSTSFTDTLPGVTNSVGDETYSLESGPEVGSVDIAPSGVFTYSNNAGHQQSVSFQWRVTNSNGFSIYTTTLLVQTDQSINNLPLFDAPTSIDLNEDTSISVDIYVSDPDLDPILFETIITSHGTISGVQENNFSSEGSQFVFEYTPDADYFGQDTIEIRVSDSVGVAQHAILVNIVPVQDSPVAVNDATLETQENTAVTSAGLLLNDSDPDQDTLTITDATAPNGTVTINGDGTVTYTPDTDFVGEDTVTYTVEDGNGGSATAQFTVVVVGVNAAPVMSDQSFTVDENAVLSASVVATDADADPLTFSVTIGVSNGSLTFASNGSFTYTPNTGYVGNDSFTVEVSDGQGGVATAVMSLTVNNVNDDPVATNDAALETGENTAVTSGNLLSNDTDADGDSLTITGATALNGSVTLNGDGTVTYTPATGFVGEDTVTYTVTDGNGGSATAQFVIRVLDVNVAPNANDDTGYIMEAGTTLILDDILRNDTDADGDSLRIVEAVASAGEVTIQGSNSLSFTIPEGAVESTVQIVYTIEDTSGLVDSAAVTIEIIPDNFAPIANDDDPVTITQGDSITIDVLSNDTDADGDILTVVSVSANQGAVIINSDGTLEYTSDSVFTGDDLVTYTIDDGRGARDSATVIVTILPPEIVAVNEPPSANNDPALTTEFETPIFNIDVLSNDSDPEGSVLNVIQASAQYGQVQINSDNTLNYTPASGFSGADVVTYTVSDGEGGRDSADFTVTVAAGAANSAPRALTDGPFTIGAEEDEITFNVLLNDVDPDGDPIELLNASADEGKLTALPDGTIRYTKPVDFDGSDTVRYTISDGRGGIGNGKATITGPATIENRAPVAAPDGPFTVVEGGRAKDIDVLANDTDADGDRLTVVSASATSGTATASDDNTVDYVAAPGFVGTDTITYEISDGQGGTASSTVSISVVAAKATNSAPVASAATFKVTTDTTLVSSLPAATDAEADPVRYVLAITAKDGIANVDGNGRFTYKPEPGFVGTDTFFYYVTDGQLNSRNYQVTLDIDGDSDGDGYLDSIDQCVNTNPGSKVDNTGCAIEEAEDFDGDGVPNDSDNCPSTPAGQDVDANGCSDEQLEEAVEDFRDIEDDVQEVSQVTTVEEETKSLATTVNTGCNTSISQGVSSGQQSSLGQACQTLKSGENTSEQVKDAVEEINYEEVSALSDNAIAANANQTKAVGNRMQVVNTGGGGGTVSVNGLNIRYGKQSIPTVALQDAVNAILGLAAGEGEDGDSFLDFGKLGIFIQGDLDFGDRDTQGNQTGYESDSWNLTIGGDYRFKDNLYGGLAFNFGETEVQYDTRGDESTIENWGMSFYGGWQITEAWYVDGLISYGNSDYSTLRNIEYTLNTGDFQATQRGDTAGTQLSYGINTGYMYSKNGFRFGPVLSFFYSDGTIDGFKEKAVKGSDAWAFDVGEQSIQSTRVSAGLQMDYSWLTDFGVIVPGLRAAYVREKEGSDDTITVRLANGDAFADGSSRFSIQNEKDDEGYYDISVNVSGQFVMGVSGFVSYQFYQDYGGYTREGYSIGIRWDKPF